MFSYLITAKMFVNFACVLQLLGLFALSWAYKIHPIITPDIPANTNLTTAPFVRIINGYYLFESTNLKNWYEAYEACRRKDAELITLETLDEFNAINRYTHEMNIQRDYWTSGTDLGKEGSHTWFTNGQPVNKDFWLKGQPDNAGKIEHCIELGYKSGRFTGLNDRQCANANGYICEAQKPVTASFVLW